MNPASPLEIKKVSDLELQWTRTFDAPAQYVFEALTTPQLVQQWLTGPPGMTMPVCEIDLRVGGRFRYVWRRPDGAEMGMGGEYREISPPHRIVHTELFDEDWTGGETRVTTELIENNGVTMLTCTVRYASKSARDAALETGMGDGVAHSYEQLHAILSA